MGEQHDRVGAFLRFMASGGMADEDPETVRELLTDAHDLATAVLDDASASPALHAKAKVFLEDLRLDANGKYDGSS